MQNSTLICFGEVLWDVLPTEKIAGGAPMNVAYHANNLGLSAKMISRVGADELGKELINFLNGKGVSTQFVQTDPMFPTGIVNVSLDAKGSPSYEIVQPVAWDYIQPDETLYDIVKTADALVFGSLACRSEQSKNTLLELLELAPLRVFDVNLRHPFFSKSLLETLLSKADFVKMNDEELAIITDWNDIKGNETAQMERLKEKYDLDLILLTKGAKGAACMDDTGYHEHSGFPVKVFDTIGSGDAFLAAFLSKKLSGAGTEECLAFACALGALVATKQGGTPGVSNVEIQQFIR